MGLYISKNLSQYLAKAGDSGLQVVSEHGVGSTFFFTLEDQRIHTNLVIHKVPRHFPQIKTLCQEKKDQAIRPNVLIVDDDEFNYMAMKLLLQNMGCQSEYANNGLLAIKMIKEKQQRIIKEEDR